MEQSDRTLLKAFLDFTFEIIAHDKPRIAAAVFTFEREDLIPDMLISLLNKQHEQAKEQLRKFSYYLNVILSPMVINTSSCPLKLVEELCATKQRLAGSH